MVFANGSDSPTYPFGSFGLGVWNLFGSCNLEFKMNSCGAADSSYSITADSGTISMPFSFILGIVSLMIFRVEGWG